MTVGAAITAWTIRASLVCYAVVLLLYAAGRVVPTRQTTLRLIWTCGLLLYLAHVAAAFHFYHDWSHTAALAHTADETEHVFGWRFGDGLYFNYLFTVLWTSDVLWWWISPATHQSRPTRLSVGLHAYLAFMVINATIVFESGPMRWTGIAVVVVVLVLLCRKRFSKSKLSTRV